MPCSSTLTRIISKLPKYFNASDEISINPQTSNHIPLNEHSSTLIPCSFQLQLTILPLLPIESCALQSTINVCMVISPRECAQSKFCHAPWEVFLPTSEILIFFRGGGIFLPCPNCKFIHFAKVNTIRNGHTMFLQVPSSPAI